MARRSQLSAAIGSVQPRFRTATQYVEHTLKQAILSGALAGGTPLRQEDLAAEFSLSRMPIREALRQLEAQALVDFYPHRGAVVTEISASEGADNYAIRGAIEPAALRLSVPHLTAADLERARVLVDEMDGDDGARLGELNRRFHMVLYSRAGRPRLLTLVDQQLAAADRFLRFHLAAMGRNHLSQEEHHAMIDACATGDVDRACAILTQHIETAARNLQEFLAPRDQQ